jgi:hypothetical protein
MPPATVCEAFTCLEEADRGPMPYLGVWEGAKEYWKAPVLVSSIRVNRNV